jgi:O-antigen ligase
METTTEVTTAQWTGGIGVIPLLILLALVVVPYWKIWKRTGHSGAWGLLMLVPLANVISLWVLAFKEWPALKPGRMDDR